MSARLRTHILVGALLRRCAASGGQAAVLARGDDSAGGLVLVLRDRGLLTGLVEAGTDLDGRYRLRPSGPADGTVETAVDDWIARRRAGDPDLWVIELDIADAERFAAETISVD